VDIVHGLDAQADKMDEMEERLEAAENSVKEAERIRTEARLHKPVPDIYAEDLMRTVLRPWEEYEAAARAEEASDE
jgi:hypothetical protein